ncbi:hypothetical protein V8G54_019518 [Vigna mungo]|uniref:Uncharacterized protein n=1 Tax=Vigna mungo TaxID=3915 RepID=A0AAQ3NBT0_VIGMU
MQQIEVSNLKLFCSHILVPVPLCNPKEYKKIEKAESGQKPVKVIKVASIQIVRDPTKTSMSCGNLSNNGEKQCAGIISHGSSCKKESHTKASHGIWCLTIEEL